ncbi:MAG: hypothetical protein AUJ92_01265 [Armatimonadetes bacterium CG2_30_59_28]|nr:right-handed parallel beta-helix repeat-containing protein [Armatimonadota bacterium]OIO98487.1 MAG: hypothetical protein AUJ92_01265 [Armatimonadetes bacterium CG2_30_59_28]PIU65516.1 MAG: hypothetical protein COS85_08470 [Armatimonadetes bacterium CG07_land_8_20_14_0_80_59_28]PIX45485.1 MAG: hypothetical protein COZ56_01755 [Armatimonadetes bacterium CG_4_8_14_3_um_filter_58_9]PIY43969.1 MAG: hypothetical protein COZ05_09580 [Armatimonadetes bacterium CG_4_10_14_3_um_filter_59_10]
MPIKVTVGPSGTDFTGADDLVIQAAIEYVSARGGGTVEIKTGLYPLSNSVRLRSGISLVGSGEETVLKKQPSATVPLTEDTDWYESRVTVSDASPFKVGGGVMLSGKSPHSGQEQVTITTVLGIEGNTLHLQHQGRGADVPAHVGNFWVGYESTAATVFSLVTGNWIHDVRVANLRINGNRGQSAALDGNYGAAMYFQDCEQVHIHNVHVESIESDGLSFQIVHDLTVEDCVFEDCVQGIHPGSGSQRPVIRNNTVRKCRNGLSWCWGVKQGVAEGNLIEDCETGISIGHRDTDNLMRCNTVRRCSKDGLVYRDDPPHQAAHNTVVADNLFENIGTTEEPGVGIDLAGPANGTVVRGNRVCCTQPGLMEAGIRIGERAGTVVLDGNSVAGIEVEVEDLRKGN